MSTPIAINENGENENDSENFRHLCEEG